MLGVGGFPPFSAAANAISIPPGEYDRKVETHEEPTIEDPKKPLKRLTNGEIIFDHVSFLVYLLLSLALQ